MSSDSDIIFGTVISALAAILVLWFVWWAGVITTQVSIRDQCNTFGAAEILDVVYICERAREVAP